MGHTEYSDDDLFRGLYKVTKRYKIGKKATNTNLKVGGMQKSEKTGKIFI
jgi:hypothetical protein